MEKGGYIYLLMNNPQTVIYTGATADLKRRIYEHKEKLGRALQKNIT